MVRLVGNISENNIALKLARINTFNLSGGGYKPLKTKHFACSMTLALVLSLTLSLALSFSSVFPAFSQEPADDHAYTLTKIEVQDPSNLPANTITKYEWSEEQNKLTPVYYRVDLKQTDYGHTTDYDEVKTFTVNTPNADNTGNAFEYTINYYVNNDSLAPDRITTDQQGKDIDMDFVGLKYEPSSGYAEGGAIYNRGTIGDITGDFIGNYAKSENREAGGGAIVNGGTIGNITGDFIGNYAKSENGYAYGGAIYNAQTIGDIIGDFIGNYAKGEVAYSGVIYNVGTIGDITGDFIGNYAQGEDGVIGGAIYNEYGTIGDIIGDFVGNYAQGEDGVIGGAIFNAGTIGKLDDDGNLIGGIYGSFINNHASTTSTSDLALGGAIYTIDDMSFIADNTTNYFSGNYTEDPTQGKIPNAIFVQTSSSSSPTIKLIAQNNGTIVFNDQIDGGKSVKNSATGKYEIDRTNAYNLALTGDNSGSRQKQRL